MNPQQRSGNPQQQQPSAQPEITTQTIQNYLDENQQLIFGILERQKQGQFDQCEALQQKLQNNLIKLATLADQPNQTTAKPTRP
ncbi:hypothetical protein C9374_000578 [Naegleria lovaniensis]|uniref:SS18 N-terminal domain-containing protein n=1 Tax=Naegleria lovaniensis TaxID=51637 RepID=A0AA88GZA1_NAELO|nr:uncharacterized protein C9374_000578 [Naegleria lovaniensis]KAG2388414.1 hypothetical protein C9374_000578 [Naegleria lovaniensis]